MDITLYHICFSEQFTQINNKSTLPSFEYRVNSIIFEIEIVSIIRSLNTNKAHGWDGISMLMIKMCHETIAVSLKIVLILH